MAACWEHKHRHRVLGAFLHTDLTSVHWSLGFRNLLPGPDEMPFLPMAGKPYDDARNTVCEFFLQSDYRYLFFLDSDVIPPSDAVLRLMAHDKPFISGVYYRRSPPHGLPVMIRDGQWVQRLTGGIMEVDTVGAGCLLIRRDFLENLPPQRPGKKWFDWRVDLRGIDPPPHPQGSCMSEDFTLCEHARKHGIPVLVDSSIRCLHIGLAEASENSMLPAETRSRT